MVRTKSTLEVIPSARRLFRSLRDVGYDFKHAVADLIDNSIEADASSIAINMHFDGEQSFVHIADNGVGMSGTAITEAMRFGTERNYEADELGKFGLGLKTASLSQCSRLTVASRNDSTTRQIETRQWDLAHVEKTNRWEIIDVPAIDCPKNLVEPLQGATGTVIMWELLDRLLGYKIPWGESARSGFLSIADELDQHLGMVFHRFLSGEALRRKKLHITLNGTRVELWDPFARDEGATLRLPEKEIKIHGDEGHGLIAWRPYILPRQDQFSSLKSFNRYAGPRKWNYQQGFYIYRADRLIQSGGWSYMRTADEHTKLARAAIDFWPDLDSAFDLNVAKARVNLPVDLKVKLRTLIEPLVRQARSVYSRRPKSSSGAGSRHKPQPATGNKNRGSGGGFPDGSKQIQSSGHVNDAADYPLAHVGHDIQKAASSVGEEKAIKRIRKALRTLEPQTAKKIGW